MTAEFNSRERPKIETNAVSELPTGVPNRKFESQSIMKLDGLVNKNVPKPAISEFPLS